VLLLRDIEGLSALEVASVLGLSVEAVKSRLCTAPGWLCGALLSKDFRFKMRVWFLKETDSICPGCSTGCNITIDHRDGEAYRIRPRRNVEVNKSWLCDPGRDLYKTIAANRVTSAHRAGGALVAPSDLLDEVATRLKEAGGNTAFLASPRASNEDAFTFKKLALSVGGRLDFRVGNPQDKVAVRKDQILQREDRHPNTQGLSNLGLGVTGVEALLADCKAGKVRVLVLQDGDLLLDLGVAEAAKQVAYVAVFATHSRIPPRGRPRAHPRRHVGGDGWHLHQL
jgi:NADH-quinone oxidoreductase subunit G